MAVIFSLTLVIAVAIAGLAIDTGRAMNTSSVLRASLDAAALAGAKAMIEQDATDAEIEAIAKRTLRAQLETSGINPSHWDGLNIDLDRQDGRVAVGVNMTVPTTFARVINVNSITAHMEGRANYKIEPTEVSLVLDVTGSMGNDNRMADMQAAAKEAVRTLLPTNQPHLNRVAIAPYAAAVNAGVLAAAVSDGRSTDGCVIERDGANAYTDEDPFDVPGGPDWFKVAADAPPGPNPAAAPHDMNQYQCPTASVIPLSNSAASLEAAIDGLSDGGYTGGHMGLAWGWYLLSPRWNSVLPGGAQAKAYGGGIKAVILMTDGDFNTSYLNGGLNETSYAQGNALCDNIKAEGVTIYTIGFAIDQLPPPRDAGAAAFLEACASDVGGSKAYYLASDGAALMAAFKEITSKIQALRVSG